MHPNTPYDLRALRIFLARLPPSHQYARLPQTPDERFCDEFALFMAAGDRYGAENLAHALIWAQSENRPLLDALSRLDHPGE